MRDNTRERNGAVKTLYIHMCVCLCICLYTFVFVDFFFGLAPCVHVCGKIN